MEKTLAIIKPDAMEKKFAGQIITRIEESGLSIIGMKLIQLGTKEAGNFYAVHKEKPFYGELVTFMTSGPVVVMVLEAEGAIAKWRALMGATNPEKADENTLRKQYGSSIQRNACHGSDAPETAKQEVSFFFPQIEFVDR